MTTALSSRDIPLLMISIIAVVANLFVCVLVFAKRRLRTRTNRFVVSLAISDILIAGILLPLCLAGVNPTVIAYMGSITLLAGVANISVVTIDRYIAVFKPFRYNEIMRFWFAKIIILAWSLSIAVSLIPLFWNTDPATTAHHVYIFTAQIGLVVLSYVLIFIAYIRIFRKVHQTVKKGKNLDDVLGEIPRARIREYFQGITRLVRVKGGARVYYYRGQFHADMAAGGIHDIHGEPWQGRVYPSLSTHHLFLHHCLRCTDRPYGLFIPQVRL